MKREVNSFAVAIVICFALLLCCLIWFKYLDTKEQHEIYPTSTIVTDVEGALITVTDFSGRVYQFYDETEDWFIDDICAIIMDNNNTKETVYDDIIISAKYCGYID